MTFQRVVEMSVKPPFKYFVMKDGYCGAVSEGCCFNYLSAAKKCGEDLFLNSKRLSSILRVYYKDGDWETRAGWLCERILQLDFDCSWMPSSRDFVIHVSFLWGDLARQWNPKLYDRIKRLFSQGVFKDDSEWDFIRSVLKINEKGVVQNRPPKVDCFEKSVQKACKIVEKKMDSFILANEKLTALVKKKYPNVRAEYAIFDRMIMFYLESENGMDKEFPSLEALEKYMESQ